MPGRSLGIDASGKLAQVGWESEPSLKLLSWAGQWLHYQSALHRNLSRPALVVPVFKPQVIARPRKGRTCFNPGQPRSKHVGKQAQLNLITHTGNFSFNRQ